MKKLARPKVYSTVITCSITLLSTLITLALINASGFHAWADKAESGPLKTIAMPVSQALLTITPFDINNHHQAIITSIHETDTWLTTPLTPKPSDITNDTPDTPTPDTPISTDNADTSITIQQPTRMPLSDILNEQFLANLPPVPLNTPFSDNLTALAKKPSLKIALVGDSMMAVGLSPIIIQSQPQHHFIKAHKSGTGLSRPEVFDWTKEYPKALKGQTPDLAIISIGANDAQDYAVKGRVVKFGTPEWLTIYGERLDNFATQLTQDNTQVIWLGMPRMKSGKFDARIDLLNRLSYQIIRRHQPIITWWYVSPHLDEIQQDTTVYREYGQNPQGKNERLRLSDGIHLSTDGAKRIAEQLFTWQDNP